MHIKRQWIIILLIVSTLLVGMVQATNTTYYLTDDSNDRFLQNGANANFTTMRNGAGTSSGDCTTSTSCIDLTASAVSDEFDVMRRAGFSFDTSGIADNATITGVTFSVAFVDKSNELGTSDAMGIGITGSSIASPGFWGAADFSNFGNTSYAANKTYDSIVLDTYTNFELNAAGIAAINKTANTTFVLRLKADLDNSTSGITWASGNSTYYSIADYTAYPTLRSFLTVTTSDEEPILYLADRGVLADGSNESVVFQAALDYATANGYRKISFPNGIIGVNAQITTGHDQELIGNGCTIKLIDNSTINHDAGFFFVHEGTYVHNLKFDGNMDNQSTAYGTWLGYPASTNGVFLYTDSRFEDNEVHDVGAYMIEIYDQDNVIVRNNSLHNSRQYCIGIKGDTEPSMSINTTVTNNTFYNCWQVGVKMGGAIDGLIANNTITVPMQWPPGNDVPEGITLYSWDYRNEGMTITNNAITGSGGDNVGIGSQDDANTDITITDNTITDIDEGINIKFDDGIITGNDIWYFTSCIDDDGSGNVISGGSCNLLGSSAPVAAFHANTTYGVSPLAVLLTDDSTLTPTSWAWYFGNGTQFSANETQALSLVEGTYTINMMATNAGGSDWENKTNYITVVSNTTPFSVVINASNSASLRERQNASFSALRDGPGNYTYSTLNIYGGDTSSGSGLGAGIYEYHGRGLVAFNTEPLPEGATISSATVTMYGRYKEQALGTANASLIYAYPDDPTTFNYTDYNNTNFTRVASDIPYSSFNVTGGNGTNVFTLNAFGIGALNTSGYTTFMTDHTASVDNTSLVWADYKSSSFSYRGYSYDSGTKKPFLTVNYAIAGSPSTSFTKNQTACTPLCTVAFTDTSTGTDGSWSWTYQDKSDTAATSYVFSTAEDPVYSWGKGNWSIRLTAAGNTTPDNSAWVNVSAGGVDMVDYNISISTTNMKVYPDDYWIYANISGLPVHPNSANYIARENAKCTGNGGAYCTMYRYKGSPINIVNGSNIADQQILHPEYKPRNTLNPVPVPDVPFARGFSGNEDGLYILDWDENKGFESYQSGSPITPNDNGSWTIPYTVEVNYSSYDITCGGGMYMGSTNAGVPSIPLQLSYEEVVAGDVQHVMQLLTYSQSKTNYVWPACYGHIDTNANAIPVGSIVRLKSSFNINQSEFNTYERTILQGWKDHGLIVTDGSYNVYSWAFNPVKYDTDDSKWTGIGISQTSFNNVHSNDFEVVDMSSLMISSSSGQIRMAPVSDFAANVTIGASPLNVQFIDQSSMGEVSSWLWQYRSDVTPNWTTFGTTQNPPFTFAANSTSNRSYTINLTVTNSYGTSSTEKPNYITALPAGLPPVSVFSANITSGTTPLIVTFTDASTNTPTNWDWYWSNDETKDSDTQSPTTIFGSAGTYNVRLYTSNYNGGDWENKTAYITTTAGVIAPTAAFSSDVTSGYPPLTVHFTDMSINSPTSWLWVFDGANTSILRDPSFTYTAVGNYTVSLTATNSGGSDVETRSGYITIFSIPVTTATPTPTPTPTPVPTTSSGPQISSVTATSNRVNITVSGVSGSDVWAVWGRNPGGYTWITANATATGSGDATIIIEGAPLIGNRLYYVKACDATTCGNEASFTTAAVTPLPTTTYGQGYKQITGMR